jgi:hypothetical protein
MEEWPWVRAAVKIKEINLPGVSCLEAKVVCLGSKTLPRATLLLGLRYTTLNSLQYVLCHG